MKFTSEKLEMNILMDEKKDMEEAASQSVSVPIIHYDHEPHSRLVFGEKPSMTWIELIQLYSETFGWKTNIFLPTIKFLC